MNLSLDEIEDGNAFERLVKRYFELMKEDPDNNISDVQIPQPGEGVDGGIDLLVTFSMSDSIKSFERVWVVQCKFREDSVGPRHLNTVNIPTLIHSYNADGYLLICKKGPTQGTVNLLERLNSKCKDFRTYQCWAGDDLVEKLIMTNELHPTFFPEYHRFIEGINN